MTSDLIDRVRQEIERTGFPLELRVADKLLNRKYHVAHNVYYLDRDENKGREVDLRALKNEFFGLRETSYAVRHCLVIECKKSASRPWVVFTSKSVSYDQNVFDLHHNGAKGSIWSVNSPQDYSRLQRAHPWFARPDRGRTFFEPFSSGPEANQAIFKALLSVVKGSIEIRRSCFGGGGPQHEGTASICFYYPVVVLDGVLYRATTTSGSLELEEVDAVLVSMYYRSSAYLEDERYTILVVREPAFGTEVQRLDAWLATTADYLKGNTAAFEVARPARRPKAKTSVAPNMASQPTRGVEKPPRVPSPRKKRSHRRR